MNMSSSSARGRGAVKEWESSSDTRAHHSLLNVVVLCTLHQIHTTTMELTYTKSSSCQSVTALPFVSPPLGDVNILPQLNYNIDVDAAHENAVNGLGSAHDKSLRHTRAYGAATVYDL